MKPRFGIKRSLYVRNPWAMIILSEHIEIIFRPEFIERINFLRIRTKILEAAKVGLKTGFFCTIHWATYMNWRYFIDTTMKPNKGNQSQYFWFIVSMTEIVESLLDLSDIIPTRNQLIEVTEKYVASEQFKTLKESEDTINELNKEAYKLLGDSMEKKAKNLSEKMRFKCALKARDIYNQIINK